VREASSIACEGVGGEALRTYRIARYAAIAAARNRILDPVDDQNSGNRAQARADPELRRLLLSLELRKLEVQLRERQGPFLDRRHPVSKPNIA
jgi:hypothetical protein